MVLNMLNTGFIILKMHIYLTERSFLIQLFSITEILFFLQIPVLVLKLFMVPQTINLILKLQNFLFSKDSQVNTK